MVVLERKVEVWTGMVEGRRFLCCKSGGRGESRDEHRLAQNFSARRGRRHELFSGLGSIIGGSCFQVLSSPFPEVFG